MVTGTTREEIGEFCVVVAPAIRTAGILTQLVKTLVSELGIVVTLLLDTLLSVNGARSSLYALAWPSMTMMKYNSYNERMVMQLK